jgi:hypothetical protein
MDRMKSWSWLGGWRGSTSGRGSKWVGDGGNRLGKNRQAASGTLSSIRPAKLSPGRIGRQRAFKKLQNDIAQLNSAGV